MGAWASAFSQHLQLLPKASILILDSAQKQKLVAVASTRTAHKPGRRGVPLSFSSPDR